MGIYKTDFEIAASCLFLILYFNIENEFMCTQMSHKGHTKIYTTIGELSSKFEEELSSKFEEFLAGRSQFDSDHGVDFSAPTCCQYVTFVGPLLRFIVFKI